MDSSPHSDFETVRKGLLHPVMGDSTPSHRALERIEEQYQALRDAAERVVGADNQSLGAMGQEGERAMVEMTDALYALRVLIEASSPAKGH